MGIKLNMELLISNYKKSPPPRLPQLATTIIVVVYSGKRRKQRQVVHQICGMRAKWCSLGCIMGVSVFFPSSFAAKQSEQQAKMEKAMNYGKLPASCGKVVSKRFLVDFVVCFHLSIQSMESAWGEDASKLEGRSSSKKVVNHRASLEMRPATPFMYSTTF